MKIFILLILCLFYSLQALAQNESGVRSANKQLAQSRKQWYDSSTAMFQTKYPIIRSIPPFSMNMPLEIFMAYTYTDSIMRFIPDGTMQEWIYELSATNDTLREMVKWMYKMNDYDPVKFVQYSWETADQTVKYDKNGVRTRGRYVGFLQGARSNITYNLQRLVTPVNDMYKMLTLFSSDYILKVNVLKIDSTDDKFDSEDRKIFRVIAEVLDTIQGKSFQKCSAETEQIAQSAGYNGTNPLLCFTYWHDVYFNNIATDSAFQDGGKYKFGMKAGQQALVFLTHEGTWIDFENDYFDLSVNYRSVTPALPIINGEVRDIIPLWSGKKYTPYTEFKDSVKSNIQKILNKSW